MVNHNSTAFLVGERVGVVIGTGLRKILVISGIGLLAKYI